MNSKNPYVLEFTFVAAVIVLTVTGFWRVYFGEGAQPDAFHHLHVFTNAAWLCLLTGQLVLINNRNFQFHRKLGLAVLFLGPLLVATTALLSAHSAYKGLVSGKGDFLIVQNVMVTLELGLLILLAIIVRKRRKLHGHFMLSSLMLFMGIALFFTLIGFVPMFKIEGPETFGRFAIAAIAGQGICLIVGFIFVIKDFRNGWPMLLAALFFPLNELLRSALAAHDLIAPFTQWVGSMNKTLVFACAFIVLLASMVATGVHKSSPDRSPAPAG